MMRILSLWVITLLLAGIGWMIVWRRRVTPSPQVVSVRDEFIRRDS